MFELQLSVFFILCDKSLHHGGRSDSSCVLRVWDGPTGARLTRAVLLIHHRGLRQGAAALTAHQQLTYYSGFVLYLSKSDYVSQYVCEYVCEKLMR